MNKPLYARVKSPMIGSNSQRSRVKLLFTLWNAEFDTFETKIRKAVADPRLDYEEQKTALRKHCHAAKSKLEEIYATWQKPLSARKQ